MNTANFYKGLITNNISLRALFNDKGLFNAVPEDWHILVAEVKEPLVAVGKGLNKDVNLVATGSIITVLNSLKAMHNGIKIPYFFRGFGATFIVPESVLGPILVALENYAVHTYQNLNLEVEIGHTAVAAIYKEGAHISIAKLKLNKYLTIPVIYGNGLKVAERNIKNKFKDAIEPSYRNGTIDLEGMECRWDELFPIEVEKKVICLLVLCKEEPRQAEVYTKIFDEIDFVFGTLNKRTPITTPKLKLDHSFQKMRTEMYARLGKFDRSYLIQNWLITYFGKFYFKFFKGGKQYLYRVTQLSDTIVLDGSINTVFSGTEKGLNTLKMLLDAMEADGKILYGMHATYASIMSCYIEDRDENHIHFVDGTEGGYIRATANLKEKASLASAPFWK